MRLCARVCRYQAACDISSLKVFESILRSTVSAPFDMCRFGLRIPKTNRFLRKRSQILTTSKALFSAVHGSRRTAIERNASINGIPQKLTGFCATYCRGFADMMARNLCNVHHTHIGDDEIERPLAFHADDVEERLAKRLRVNQHGI